MKFIKPKQSKHRILFILRRHFYIGISKSSPELIKNLMNMNVFPMI